MSTPSSSIGSRPRSRVSRTRWPGGGRVEPLVGVRAVERERVDPVAQLDADPVEALALDVEVGGAVSAEVDLEPAEAVAQRHRLVVRAAGHDQRPLLDADRRRPVDELALAVARLGAPQVAADPLGERAGELRVGELGDQQQTPAERHGSAEQLLARRLVGEQPVAQRLRGHAGDLELDRVDLVVAARQVIEREHRLLPEATADLVGDRVQLVVGDVVDVEPARALERRRPLVGREEDAVEQLRAARRSAAPLHDPLDLVREAGQLVAQTRVAGIGDHGGVVGREDLGAATPPIPTGSVVLEAGCGVGAQTVTLAGRSPRRRVRVHRRLGGVARRGGRRAWTRPA